MIGIAGGSGSGKTTFSKLLTSALGEDRVTFIAQDSYYIDQSARFDRDGGAVNFDHPDSLDWPLLTEHLKLLKSGKPANIPIYDFATHKRKKETMRAEPRDFVILDGILIFVPPSVQRILDVKVFINTNEELRFQRRLERDVRERGRTPEGVHAQFYNQVKPMHDQFVEPSRAAANVVVSGERDFTGEIQRLVQELR